MTPEPQPRAKPPDEPQDELAEERLAREAALIGQEHRLVPAIRNLADVWFRRGGRERAELLPSAISALAWCLVPSPATTAVSGLALVTLFITWQQSRLLAVQNNKIEVQNMLAEAQRRASLVFEISAIFERIDAETEVASKDGGRRCSAEVVELCYRDGPESRRGAFVPSRAVLGRIAALTQALRPYRYLTVEGTAGLPCPQDTTSAQLTEAYQALLGAVVARGPKGAREPLTPDQAVKLAQRAYASPGRDASGTVLSFIGRWLGEIADIGIGPEVRLENQLNCAPASPERGQMLVSLHAAGIDISAIQAAGGDFTYSDFPRASLDGIDLTGVNLSGARLSGANLANSRLTGVIFRGADLSNARFAGAVIEKSDFEGARIQVYQRDGDAPWFFLPRHSNDNLLSGLQMYQEAFKPNTFERLCASLRLPSGLAFPSATRDMSEAAKQGLMIQDPGRLGLLVETRQRVGSGKAHQFSTLVFALGLPRQTLVDQHGPGGATRLEYVPLGDCEKR